MTFVMPAPGPAEGSAERRVRDEPVQCPTDEAILVEHIDRDRDRLRPTFFWLRPCALAPNPSARSPAVWFDRRQVDEVREV